MNILENVRLAFRGLLANKVRAGLTVLGIFIGVLAVILGTAIGQGSKSKILESVQSLGANTIIIFSSQNTEGKAAGDAARLTLKDAELIQRNCSSITRVAATFSGSARAKFGRRAARASVVCSQPSYWPIRELQIAAGRAYSERDVRGRRKVVVLGPNLGKKLFGPNVDAAAMIGKRVRLEGIGFVVIGVTMPKGAALFDNLDENAFVPLSSGMKTLFGAKDPTEINAQIASQKVADKAKTEIGAVLRRTHRLKKGDKDDFQVFTQQQLLTIGDTIGGILTGLLSGIAGVALLVGGIGIMNIMLVSVTERTREIGIRKAIGARPRDIQLQFLVEATTLSAIGGVAGIVAGVLISALINAVFHFPASVSVFWASVAFFVSAAIGIFFGLYPASKAAKLDPIEALRYQ
ncbi:putative ABC transport system permease protein [Abditibacterium utsteinense]|uniref:Putative ABC transport system permease protein n=1 Tax=Abditibacterium utsteinense TaxID=1960156 RepID=A0A2S8SSX3_9BACT|nr:ABC transporter permease [Abditibacterium utsteinense]PQV63868.1 putative ABC transport system permease protein [Abditibacterium utsteinense]